MGARLYILLLPCVGKIGLETFYGYGYKVVTNCLITEILPKREEIRKRAMTKLGDNLARYHIVVDDNPSFKK